jgi:hypothetical protein
MYKIDLRLKTLFPAIMGATDEPTDIEFKVISENGTDIDKSAVVTATDITDNIYGVENIYAYKDSLIIEVKRDPDEDDFDEDDCSTDEDNDYDENPYTYFDIHDDKPFYDGPKLVVNNSNKIPEGDAIFDSLSTCYSKSSNKTEIIIVYHYKDNNPLQAQFYLDGDKTMLTNEEILREIYDSL